MLGVVLDLDYSRDVLTVGMDSLKQRVFGTKDIVLHRKELLKREPPPYDALLDPRIQKICDELLLKMISQAQYTAIAVMIDKKALVDQYPQQVNPYHYCLMALVERYINWLREQDKPGVKAVGDVMAESRTKKANKKLSEAYRYLYKHGTRAWSSVQLVHRPEEVQERLTSGEIKLQGKSANEAGLQLADLLANPARRDLICRRENVPMDDGFGKVIVSVLRTSKYRRALWYPYKLEGYGIKVLP